ncbi:helix-turn-helix transcriptional regulator [Photobacterium halotolerans]|nr:WYL domain-containing protein [Photobacterium halotolerans]
MKKEHDKLAKRLGIILTRLNTGERLHLDDLAREFNVSARTLQRDFNTRLDYLPLQREGSTYFIDPKYLGRQSAKDISTIVVNMGLDCLFPGKQFLANGMLNGDTTPPYLFRNIHMENSSHYLPVFQQLTEAIQRHYLICFQYEKRQCEDIQPYRLLNDHGIWYLTATEQDRLKMYRLSQISQLAILEARFKPDSHISQQLNDPKLCLRQGSMLDLVIQVDASVAPQFQQASLLPKQQILKQLDDGSLILSSQVSNLDSVLPTLKAWLPHIDVLSPDSIRQCLYLELHAALDRIRS